MSYRARAWRAVGEQFHQLLTMRSAGAEGINALARPLRLHARFIGCQPNGAVVFTRDTRAHGTSLTLDADDGLLGSGHITRAAAY